MVWPSPTTGKKQSLVIGKQKSLDISACLKSTANGRVIGEARENSHGETVLIS